MEVASKQAVDEALGTTEEADGDAEVLSSIEAWV